MRCLSVTFLMVKRYMFVHDVIFVKSVIQSHLYYQRPKTPFMSPAFTTLLQFVSVDTPYTTGTLFTWLMQCLWPNARPLGMYYLFSHNNRVSFVGLSVCHAFLRFLIHSNSECIWLAFITVLFMHDKPWVQLFYLDLLSIHWAGSGHF